MSEMERIRGIANVIVNADYSYGFVRVNSDLLKEFCQGNDFYSGPNYSDLRKYIIDNEDAFSLFGITADRSNGVSIYYNDNAMIIYDTIKFGGYQNE